MTLNELCEYIKNPLAEVKARVVIVPPGESWTTLRRFCQERDYVELRLSDLVCESAWLPMPDEVFCRIHEAMKVHEASGKALVLLGLPGYLALLKDENKRTTIVALREWVDGASGREAVCFLQSDDGTSLILNDVFANPRYSQGKQLIKIDPEQAVTMGRMEVMLVEDALSSLVPDVCDTFQKYLRYTEELPNDSTVRRIVIASEGRELAGLSAEVRQVVCLRDFALVFYNVEDAGLSEDALRWMCERGKEGTEKTLSETLKTLFFPEGGVAKRVLRVFDGRQGVEREVVLWLVKQVASNGSYLARVARQEGVLIDNFRSAYVTGAVEWLDESVEYPDERKVAILEANASTYLHKSAYLSFRVP